MRVNGLAGPAMSIIPQVLAAIHRENTSGRRLTHGQRQQRAAELLRFQDGGFTIRDILGREIQGRRR